MIKWIIQDVKRNLKNRKTLLLFTVVCISIGTFFFKMQTERSFTNPLDYDDFTPTFVSDNTSSIISKMEHSFPIECTFDETIENCENYLVFKKYQEQLIEEEASLTVKQTQRLRLFFLDINTDNFINYFDNNNEKYQSLVSPKVINVDYIIELKEEIKKDLDNEFEYFMRPTTVASTREYNESAITLAENYSAYKNNYPLSIKLDITGSIFLAHYINEFFLLLVVVAILLVFDSFYRDYKLGVTKNILSAPMKRSRYIVTKTTAAMISIIIVIFIPLIITYIILYIYNGYDSLYYPIYISRTTLNSFDPVLKHSRIISDYKPAESFSTYKNICTHLPVFKFPVDITGESFTDFSQCSRFFPYANVTIISLKNYLVLVIGYLILIILFISNLNTLFSFIFKDQIYNLVGLLLTLAFCLLLTTLFVGSTFLKYIPFTFLSPTNLLMQTIPYTFLNGVVVLSVYTLFLMITNRILIKKIDFPY